MRLSLLITDDRGRRMRTTVGSLGPLRNHSDSLTRARAREIESGMRSDRPYAIRMTFVAVALALPLFALPVLLPWLMPLLRAYVAMGWILALAAFLGLLGPLAMAFILRALMLSRIVRAYVRAGFCGACGFPLDEGQTEPDGCTLCPECGAAWNTP